VKSSYFMSDELCHAILDHQEAIKDYSPQILSMQEELTFKANDLVLKSSDLEELEFQLDNILTLLDIAQATEDEDLINRRKQERSAKQAEISNKETEITQIVSEIESLESQIELLRTQISDESGFTDELIDELDLFIIEKEWSDDNYIDPQDLYNDALIKFSELRQPKIVIDIDIDNLFNVIEEQYYWDKLNIGDLIKVKYPQMNIEYKSRIIEINYDFANDE